MSKKFSGVEILEVWDFRLSKGSPILYSDGETWVVKIWANDPGDNVKELLEEHNTGVSTDGGINDRKAIAKCYEWLMSVRDKYPRDNIELRKPITKMINLANAEANALNSKAEDAKANGDTDLFYKFKGELQSHVSLANAAIKQATKVFHDKVATGV